MGSESFNEGQKRVRGRRRVKRRMWGKLEGGVPERRSAERRTLYAVVLLDIGSTLNGFLIAVVPDGDVGTRLGESLCDSVTNAGACTGDDGGLALVGE